MPTLEERILVDPQHSNEWFAARCGIVTASNVHLTKERLTRKSTKGEVGDRSAAAKTYMLQLACERLTGKAEEHYVSYQMDRGTEYESNAREAYTMRTGRMVQQVGFVRHPRLNSGCSPDGLIVDISDPLEPTISPNGIEIKCCLDFHHLEYMGIVPGAKLIDGVPEDFIDQIDWCMACCESEWWDFVPFHPGMPEHLQCREVRLYRDAKREAELEKAVIEFSAEVDELLAKLEAA